MKLVRLVTALAALQFSAAAFAQSNPPFSSLEEQMTAREFQAAGLDKLSPEELATLNDWIRSRSLATLDEPRGGSRQQPTRRSGEGELPSAPGELPPVDRMAREAFQTRLVGELEGWNGNTRFELENGMVWQQVDSTRYRFQPIENPVVTIKPGLLGSWYLKVEGHKRTVRVERIK